MLSRLFSIGQGALLLPYLDSEEARSVHVSKEISFVLSGFDFHVNTNASFGNTQDNLFRHRGTTFHNGTRRLEPALNMYYLDRDSDSEYVNQHQFPFQSGRYDPNINAIIPKLSPSYWEWYSRETDDNWNDTNAFIEIDGIIYLFDSRSRDRLHLQVYNESIGPFHPIVMDGTKVMKCPSKQEREPFEQYEAKQLAKSPYQQYLYFRWKESHPSPRVTPIPHKYITQYKNCKAEALLWFNDLLEEYHATNHLPIEEQDEHLQPIFNEIPDDYPKSFYKLLFAIFATYMKDVPLEFNDMVIVFLSDIARNKPNCKND